MGSYLKKLLGQMGFSKNLKKVFPVAQRLRYLLGMFCCYHPSPLGMASHGLLCFPYNADIPFLSFFFFSLISFSVIVARSSVVSVISTNTESFTETSRSFSLPPSPYPTFTPISPLLPTAREYINLKRSQRFSTSHPPPTCNYTHILPLFPLSHPPVIKICDFGFARPIGAEFSLKEIEDVCYYCYCYCHFIVIFIALFTLLSFLFSDKLYMGHHSCQFNCWSIEKRNKKRF